MIEGRGIGFELGLFFGIGRGVTGFNTSDSVNFFVKRDFFCWTHAVMYSKIMVYFACNTRKQSSCGGRMP
jgi:hypothetical protein